MQWLIGSFVLVTVGVLLRQILHMDFPHMGSPASREGGLIPLRLELHSIYRPVAQEIETHSTILGITLNDAFSEREADHPEMAWHVVQLAVGEWDRLMALVINLLNMIGKYVPTTEVVVPVRRVTAGNFKSREAIDYIGFYEFLDQVLFNSRRRFALQLRLLFRTGELLTKEFHHTCQEGEITLDSSPEVWNRLDFYFHDFDLITKETLLAFRTLLACQSPQGAQELAADLQSMLERGVRASIPAVHQ